jgi:hypothetical protein
MDVALDDRVRIRSNEAAKPHWRKVADPNQAYAA